MNQESKKKRETWPLSPTEVFSMVSGTRQPTSAMAEDIKYGLMAQYTMVIGRMTKQMDEDDLFMLMETFMMVIGKMTRLMGSDFTSTLKERNTKVIGKMTNNTEKGKKNG